MVLDSGFAGTTTGGVQDVASARSAIDAGWIPDPESITVEGFLSEHDIAITPPQDPGTFYPSVGVAWRKPFGASAAGVDLAIGIGSTIDADAFQRAPLNLAVVVDRSGSMDERASGTDSRTKMEAVQDALHNLLDQLNGEDLITVISFNEEPKVELHATAADRRDTIEAVIDRLFARGYTGMEAALQLGFDEAHASSRGARSDRVILLTDALPNVGATDADAFINIIEDGADRGIGFTLLGVGINHDDDLAYDISQVAGANAYFLSDEERIASIFDDDFKFLVTPVAHDLNIDILIPEGVGIADVYGIPDYVPGTGGARIHVPTLFLSRREGGGAIMVRLTLAEPPTPEVEFTVADVSIAYTLTDEITETADFQISLPADVSPTAEPPYYSDSAARRAALLLDCALVLRDASDAALDGRRQDAVDMLEAFLGAFENATLGLPDRTDPSSRGLSDEREVLENLLGNVLNHLEASRYPPWYY